MPPPADAWFVFDVGGVLVDETRVWQGWAAHLAVPYETLWGALCEDIAQGLSHRHTMQRLAPGHDIMAIRRARLAQDAADLGDVLDAEREQHEVHCA